MSYRKVVYMYSSLVMHGHCKGMIWHRFLHQCTKFVHTICKCIPIPTRKNMIPYSSKFSWILWFDFQTWKFSSQRLTNCQMVGMVACCAVWAAIAACMCAHRECTCTGIGIGERVNWIKVLLKYLCTLLGTTTACLGIWQSNNNHEKCSNLEFLSRKLTFVSFSAISQQFWTTKVWSYVVCACGMHNCACNIFLVMSKFKQETGEGESDKLVEYHCFNFSSL